MILSSEALVVPVVELLEDKDEGRWLGQLEVELLIPLWLPGNFNANPALAALPVWIAEQTRSVKMLVLFHHIFKPYPEDGIVPELVTKFVLDVLVPLLRSIGPWSLPYSFSGFTPRISTNC
jgi:hypothetical protein